MFRKAARALATVTALGSAVLVPTFALAGGYYGYSGRGYYDSQRSYGYDAGDCGLQGFAGRPPALREETRAPAQLAAPVQTVAAAQVAVPVQQAAAAQAFDRIVAVAAVPETQVEANIPAPVGPARVSGVGDNASGQLFATAGFVNQPAAVNFAPPAPIVAPARVAAVGNSGGGFIPGGARPGGFSGQPGGGRGPGCKSRSLTYAHTKRRSHDAPVREAADAQTLDVRRRCGVRGKWLGADCGGYFRPRSSRSATYPIAGCQGSQGSFVSPGQSIASQQTRWRLLRRSKC